MRILKNHLLFFFFFIAFYSALAQRDTVPKPRYGFVFGVAPSLFAPGFKFEFPKNSWSFGFHVKGHWPFNIGGKVEPFARVYFKHRAPEGLYLQMKLTTGAYYEWFRGFGLYSNDFSNDLWYASIGTGLTVGHQWVLADRANLIIDLAGGIQASVPVPWTSDNRAWVHYWLPGFPLEISVRIGKAFYRK